MAEEASGAVAGIDSTGRLVCFINGKFFHTPVLGVLSTANKGHGVDSLDTITANTTSTIPAGWALDEIFIVNTTANAVTGGLRVGTTNGGTQVIDQIDVGANAIVDTSQSLDWFPKLRLFSITVDTTLFIQAIGAWNSASLRIRIVRTKLF
jgi:hypothetical protein